MPAFRAAVAHGYGRELDIHITRDGKVVVFQDDTLERMCGGHGKVEDYTLEELRKLHLLNTTERIPELQDVLEYVDGRVPLLVELKIPGRDLRVCEASYDILKTYHGKNLVQSFNTLGLLWYHKYAPAILRGQLSSNLTADPLNDPYILRFLVKYLMLNVIGRPDFISYKLKDLPNCSVLICRWQWRIPVAVWTLRTEQALQQGKVDCVVIDQEPAKAFVAENPGLKILDTEYVTEDYAIAVKKGNTELLDQINETLAKLKADGTLQSINDKYKKAE